MSLALRPAQLVDVALSAMNLIEDDRAQWKAFTGRGYDPNEVAQTVWGFTGPKWSLCDESGMPLATAGLQMLRPNVYESWFLSGTEIWELHYEDVTKVTKQVINDMLDAGIRRIQTTVLERRHKTRAWYGKLGLHCEADMPYYGANGENAVMYCTYRARGT